MIVRLKLFAIAKQLADCESIELDLPEGGTVSDLRSRLIEQLPGLAGMADQLMFAINEQYATDGSLIPESADVACIPPVSGG